MDRLRSCAILTVASVCMVPFPWEAVPPNTQNITGLMVPGQVVPWPGLSLVSPSDRWPEKRASPEGLTRSRSLDGHAHLLRSLDGERFREVRVILPKPRSVDPVGRAHRAGDAHSASAHDSVDPLVAHD